MKPPEMRVVARPEFQRNRRVDDKILSAILATVGTTQAVAIPFNGQEDRKRLRARYYQRVRYNGFACRSALVGDSLLIWAIRLPTRAP